MGIKEFLIQNYIWIIVIIVITIITIIGFLADKKKSGKKKETSPTQNLNNQQANNQAQVQYQTPIQPEVNQMNNNLNNNANNNWGVNYNNMNTTINPINQMNNISNNVPTPVSSIPQPMGQPMQIVTEPINSPQPVENVVRNVATETMYQPSSEQKTTFAPPTVPNFTYTQNSVTPENNQPNTIPTNVISIPIENNSSVISVTSQPTEQQISSERIMPEQMQTGMPTYNNIQIPVQPIENNYSTPVTNFIPNNITQPQPVNPIQVPQQIISESMIQEGYNQPQMIQPNFGQQIPQQNQNIPIGQPIQSVPTSSQPVNFVYGPQNNQNM